MRLLRSEVDRFTTEGGVVEEIRFGANTFRYSLQSSRDVQMVHARFEDDEISIIVPETLATEWTTSDKVGISVDHALEDGETLSILVEKDFVCIDRPNDPDRDDAFPNPNVSC